MDVAAAVVAEVEAATEPGGGNPCAARAASHPILGLSYPRARCYPAPVLFYVACIVLFITASVTHAATLLACLYVALRIAHSLIHLSYNNVMHRLAG